MDSGSTQPIFKIKTESVREKVHLSFAARRHFKSSVNFQKISFEPVRDKLVFPRILRPFTSGSAGSGQASPDQNDKKLGGTEVSDK